MSREFPYLDEDTYFPFPAVETAATEEGIVAAGGNLSPGMLLSAYKQGIFPWYSDDEPILWWSPDPRFVLFPDELHVSHRMERVLRKKEFRVTFDHAFDSVIEACRTAPRPGQDGTWITAAIVEGYGRLHELGYAHSVESWKEGELVGGLYGVSLGSIFFGESMFTRVPNASKAALIELVARLRTVGVTLIDCQSYTSHLESLGARNIARSEFFELLAAALEGETLRGRWDEGPERASEADGAKEERCRPGSSMCE